MNLFFLVFPTSPHQLSGLSVQQPLDGHCLCLEDGGREGREGRGGGGREGEVEGRKGRDREEREGGKGEVGREGRERRRGGSCLFPDSTGFHIKPCVTVRARVR